MKSVGYLSRIGLSFVKSRLNSVRQLHFKVALFDIALGVLDALMAIFVGCVECLSYQIFFRPGRDPRDIYLFAGNPGSGKSTLVNALIGEVLFKSGVSFGRGLTETFQTETYNGAMYIDSPGLDDAEVKEKAAQEITKALKQNGKYHVFFVVTMESGRVRPADSIAMRLILESAPDIKQYSVIINKVTKPIMDKFEQNPDEFAKVKTCLLAGLPEATNRFFVIPKDENLEDLDDQLMKKLPDGLEEFVRSEPGMLIQKSDVKDIVTERMQEKVDAQASMVEDLRRSLEGFKTEMNRQRSNIERNNRKL